MDFLVRLFKLRKVASSLEVCILQPK